MDIRKKQIFDMIKHVIIFSFELPNENHKIYEFTCYNTQAWRLGTCTNELYNILMSNFPTSFKNYFVILEMEQDILERNYSRFRPPAPTPTFLNKKRNHKMNDKLKIEALNNKHKHLK